MSPCVIRRRRGTPSRYTSAIMAWTGVHSGPTHASDAGTPIGGLERVRLAQFADTATRMKARPRKSENMGAAWTRCSKSGVPRRLPPHAVGPGRLGRGRPVIEPLPRATCASRPVPRRTPHNRGGPAVGISNDGAIGGPRV